MKPTKEEVERFYAHFAERFGSRVVPKERSPLMWSAGLGLSLVRVMSMKRFQESFTTVVGRTIYAPYTLGQDGERYGRWTQMVICAHEHQHIVQLERTGRLRYSTRYPLSRVARARWEVEAYTVNLEMHHWRTGKEPNVGGIMDKLRSYALSERTLAESEQTLERNAERIVNGELITECGSMAIAWLEDNAPHIRKALTATRKGR